MASRADPEAADALRSLGEKADEVFESLQE
jgi:hypothetical protein